MAGSARSTAHTRGQKKKEEMDSAFKVFFGSKGFAVAGASSDPRKFGHKGTYACLYVTSYDPLDGTVWRWWSDGKAILTRAVQFSLRMVSAPFSPRHPVESPRPNDIRSLGRPQHYGFPLCSSGPSRDVSLRHHSTGCDQAVTQGG